MIVFWIVGGGLIGYGLDWLSEALPHLAHKPVPPQHFTGLRPVSMLISALYFAYLGNVARIGPYLLCGQAFAFLLLIALIDLRYRLILNLLVYPALVLTLLLQLLIGRLPLGLVLLGGIMALAIFGFTAWLRPGDLGGGDVKLALLIGLALGFPTVLWALLVGVGSGAVTAVTLLLLSRRQPQKQTWTRKSQIPYAPFLCLGAIVALLYNPIPFPA